MQREGNSWTLLEMQRRLNHTSIDLVKMGIEGFKFPLLNSWPELAYRKESSKVFLPVQILIEVHYQTVFPNLDMKDFMTATDPLEMQRHLMHMGYVAIVRDDNRLCPHCTELELIRVRCPNTGVYSNLW